jgi:hypothetical protein
LLGSATASKNDSNDALATAIAGLRHCGLRAVWVEDHTAVLRMLIDRYDDLVALRTQAACDCMWLRELIAGGAAPPFGASPATKLLRNIHPQGAAGLGPQAPTGRDTDPTALCEIPEPRRAP